MLNSKDLGKLRPDVGENARLWQAACRAQGLDVEISNTVRDNEYQAYLYTLGRTVKKKPDGSPQGIVTNGKVTTFHGAGLAIDFYSKSKGWSDHSFFVKCGAIAKQHGFSWAGDWKSFIEYCHIQWDNNGKSTHRNAPTMPKYEEVEDMTAEQARQIAREEIAGQNMVYRNFADIPLWGKPVMQKLLDRKAINDGKPIGIDVSYDLLRQLVINDRMGLYGGVE